MARINMGKDLGHMIDLDLLSEKAVIIDGGVCIGGFIHELASLTDITDFTIIGFEPSKTNIDNLGDIVKDINIQIENKAIVGKSFPDRALFYEFKDAGLEEWGNIMGLYKTAARNRGAKQVEYLVDAITVEKMFDIYNISHIDYLKLDIEGAEFNLVSTLTQEIANKISQLSMEVHEEEGNPARSKSALIETLTKLGFQTHFEHGELYGCRK